MLESLPKDYKRRLGIYLGMPHIRWSLNQLRCFGFVPLNVLDAGAFKGEWAKECLRAFPEAHITCIEPQDACQEELQLLAEKYSNVRIVQILLGRSGRDGIAFDEIGSGSSVLMGCGKGSTKPMTSIDALIKSGYCKPPDFLKLDVQGYELEILEGYKRNLDACHVIQCEISLLPIIQGAPLLYDVVKYLHEKGFVMFDIDELIRAPSDGAVWQIDALFCRFDSPLRSERVWRMNSSII
jgi:FkbM family methyltransferase